MNDGGMAMAKRSSQFWALFLFSIGVFMAQLDNGIISRR